MPKTYLGDAVYAETTDFGLRLTTEDGVRVTNTIHLEKEVIAALMEYIKGVHACYGSRRIITVCSKCGGFSDGLPLCPDCDSASPHLADIEWAVLGHKLREDADSAHGGTAPSLDIAWSFLLDNPECFGYDQWPSDMPLTAPEELQRAYGMVTR